MGRFISPGCLSIYFLNLLLIKTSATLVPEETCLVVSTEYRKLGFKDRTLDHPVSDNRLKFCKNSSPARSHDDVREFMSPSPSALTCCSPNMEHKLSVQSRQDFDNKFKRLLNPLANLMDKRRMRFDGLFNQLMKEGWNAFNETFDMAYGKVFRMNSRIFEDFFFTLKDYYTKGETNLKVELENFFRDLHRKIFQVFNSQYIYNDDFLNCLDRPMAALKPFKDIPEKLTISVKRSFVAMRAFSQGVRAAGRIVRNLIKVNPVPVCLRELMRMGHCATCQGHLAAKPCLSYCLEVQRICGAHRIPLAELWKKFINAMEKLADRLEGPFNIGNEVFPMRYTISGAVMNFQESGGAISDKVIQDCGELKLRPKPLMKRDAEPKRDAKYEINYESFDFSRPSSGGKRGGRWRSHGGSVDDAGRKEKEQIMKLIREIKTKLKNSAKFWDDLPNDMCDDARDHNKEECWNGREMGRYSSVTSLNISESSMQNPNIDEHLFMLKLITSKLEDAYHDRDVSWTDHDWLSVFNSPKREPQDDYAGIYDIEGSGEGSGVNPIDARPPVDDNENIYHLRPSANYPPDDEDGIWHDSNSHMEGSGVYVDEKIYPSHHHPEVYAEGSGGGSFYDREPNTNWAPPNSYPGSGGIDKVPKYNGRPTNTRNKPNLNRENPSAAPTEKPMSLSWAVAVYLLPAVFTFLESIA